jgi:hypothetical protein
MVSALRLLRDLAILWLLAFMAGSCGRSVPLEYGQPVRVSSAIPLAQLLDGDLPASSELVVVSGRVKEVCRSSGCWLILEQSRNGKVYELYVDLKPRADFTVMPALIGRDAFISGIVSGRKPDLQLEAVGLTVR